MVKTIQMTPLQNHQADLAYILQEAYGAPRYIKQLKSFRSDHKQALIGWGKVGKNDAKLFDT